MPPTGTRESWVAAILCTMFAVGQLSALNGAMGSKAERLPVFGSLLAALHMHPRFAMQILRHSKIAI